MPSQTQPPIYIEEDVVNLVGSTNDLARRVNENIARFDGLMISEPQEYEWLYTDVQAFRIRLMRIKQVSNRPVDENRVRLEDMIGTLRAYRAMMLWRSADLLDMSTRAVGLGRSISMCMTSRSLLEGAAYFLDLSSKVTPLLDGFLNIDLSRDIVNTADLEAALLKAIYASKEPGTEKDYVPTNILTIVKKMSKRPGSGDFALRYGEMSEVAHPNFLGLSAHITSDKSLSPKGAELRVISGRPGKSSILLLDHTLWALSWATAGLVDAAQTLAAKIEELDQALERAEAR